MRAPPALLPCLTVLGALLLSPGGPARADLIYVLNSGDASISLIDGPARQAARRIPVLREPHHLVLTPDRKSLIVADSAANELIFLDPATAEVQRRERISNPYHLDFSPDGKWLVIASLRRDQVDLYEAPVPGEPIKLVRRHNLPDKPSHMAFSPDGKRVFVTLQGTGNVVAISLETQEVLWEAPVGAEPAGILWQDLPEIGGRLIVGIMGAEHFAVLNPETKEVERTVPIGRGAHTIFRAPDGRTLWGTSRVDSRLAEIDPATLEVRKVHEIPGGPDDLAFDPDGRVWMTLRWVGRVGVLDPATGAVETIRVGRSPHGIFVQPVRGPDGRPVSPAVALAPPTPPPPSALAPSPRGRGGPVRPVAAPAAEPPPLLRP